MRNLYLFLICISLVVFVYFFEEKKQEVSIVENEKRSELFSQVDFGELISIEGRRFKIENSNDIFSTQSGFKISTSRIEMFMSQIQSIKVQRILKDDEIRSFGDFSVMSTLIFKFEKGELKVDLGQKLDINTSFYICVTNMASGTKKYAIAKYENSYSENLSIDGNDEAYRSSAPYEQLLTVFGIEEEFFYNLNPFMGHKVSTIKYKTFRSPEYEINLLDNQTTPKILNGVEYNLEKFKAYTELLNRFSAKKISKKVFDLSDEIGSMNIEANNYLVYKRYGAKIGYFLSTQDLVYEIDSASFRSLFSPAQDFWLKKLNFRPSQMIQVSKSTDDNLENVELSQTNYWGRLLLSEAHNIREHIEKDFPHSFVIKSENNTYLVGQSNGGIEVLDKKSNLIFQFLEKLQ